MNISKKGFSIIELIVVITIIVILVGFGFSKISNFFNYQNTISSIDEINRIVLKTKIESTLNKGKVNIIFNKKNPLFYGIYIFKENSNILNINSGSLINSNGINITFSSDIKNFTGNLIIDDSKNYIKKEIYFNSSGISNQIYFDLTDFENKFFYIKKLDDLIITGKLNILSIFLDDKISISNIIGTDFSDNEKKIDYFEINNLYSGKFKIYTNNNGSVIQLKKVKISFLDKNNNGNYLEFY